MMDASWQTWMRRMQPAWVLMCLLGTAWALMATTCTEPCPRHERREARFDVDGPCGSGELHLLLPANNCGVFTASVSPGLLLPGEGNWPTGYRLSPNFNDAGWQLDGLVSVPGSSDGGTQEGLYLTCLAGKAGDGGHGQLELTCIHPGNSLAETFRQPGSEAQDGGFGACIYALHP